MNVRRTLAVTTALSSFIFLGCSLANAPSKPSDSGLQAPAAATGATQSPQDALLMVLNQTVVGNRIGYAAVLGDGTLAVTAYHIAFDQSELGVHTQRGNLSAMSPYLGEYCYPRIIASSRQWDVAIIELPWRGHPGLTLAAAEALDSAADATLISFNWPGSDPDKWFEHRTERLPVKLVTSVNGNPVQIELDGYGSLGVGWSGCPILASDTGALLGCFTAIREPEMSRQLAASLAASTAKYYRLSPRVASGANGPAAGLIRQLVVQAGRDSALTAHPPILSSPADAGEATGLLLRAASTSSRDTATKEDVRLAEACLELRPSSPAAALRLANWLGLAGEIGRAENAFRRALELNPAVSDAFLAYGQFLAQQRRLDEALAQFAKAKELTPDDVAVDEVLIQALMNAGKFDDALARVNDALARDPDNAYLWMLRSMPSQVKGNKETALDDMEHAVALYPDNYLLRKCLALLSEKYGFLDKSEQQFRAVIELIPNQPQGCYDLANFLAAHRPEARDKAAELAKRALELYVSDADKSKAEQLLKRLQSLPAQ